MQKRIVALIVVTTVWVLTMATYLYYSSGSKVPWWGWTALAAAWWFVIDSTKKPSVQESGDSNHDKS